MEGLQLDRSQILGYKELDQASYNLAVGGLLLYGVVVNALICFFGQNLIYYLSGGTFTVFLLIYFGCALLSVALSNSQSAAVNFVGYNLLVLPIGILLALTVPGFSFQTIQSALVGTGVFLVLMTGAAYVKPEFFLSLGSTLRTGLIVTLIAEIVLGFLGLAGGYLDYAVVAIFSLYLGFDWARANSCPPTLRNAILSATQIYLDIVNIFLRLLMIFGRNSRRR